MGTLTCLYCYRAAGLREGHILGCIRTRREPSDAGLIEAIRAAFKQEASS